tara:strand:+ start:279 stop:530 length:252 start_codon:yes stop_codon:yes gene_type:complete
MDNLSDDEASKIKASKRKLVNKKYYNNNRGYYNDYYNKHRDYLTAKNKYYYYNKHDRLDEFIKKYPMDVRVLQERGINFNQII